MTGEWHTARLNLPAYLERVGDTGELTPTGQTLRRLHRAHVTAIPFENLDIPLGRGISVELDDVQAKLVGEGRGGYCHEHGVLFAAVLERIGYSVDRLLARIGDDRARPRPRTHLTLRARGDDGQWLADVGFGAGLLEPLPWADTGPHTQAGWIYQFLPCGQRWQLIEHQGEARNVLYSVIEEPQHAVDVVLANHFTATHPSSPFVGQPVLMRKDSDVHLRLRGRRLVRHASDGAILERELTDTEFTKVVQDEFGVPLPDHEITELLSGL